MGRGGGGQCSSNINAQSLKTKKRIPNRLLASVVIVSDVDVEESVDVEDNVLLVVDDDV